jgi:hypothetical protein
VPYISGAGGGGGTQGQEVGYDQITAQVAVASTTESAGTTIISCAAHTFNGNAVICEFFCPYLENGSAAAATVTVSLFEASTQITRLAVFGLPSATLQAIFNSYARYRFTPTAGSHTYTVTAFANVTTGSPAVGAGSGGTNGYAPAFIRFTQV